MQTSWVKNSLTQLVIEEAHKQQVEITLEGINGTLPLRWSLKKATILLKDGSFIEVENAKVRLSLFSLFRKKLSVRFISFDLIHYFFSKEDPNRSLCFDLPASIPLPFDLSAKTIRCKKLVLENRSNKQTLSLYVLASAKIDRCFKEGHFNVLLQELETENSLKLEGMLLQKKELFEGTLDLHLASHKQLFSFFELPYLPLPLTAHLKASTLPNHTFFCENFWVQADFMDLRGEFEVSSDLVPISGAISCFLPNIEQLNLPLPLKGEVSIKTMLNTSSFLASCSSKELSIGKETFSPVSLELSATKKNNLWEGFSKAHFNHPLLPLKESCHFTLDSNDLNIFDLSLHCAETQLGGSGAYSFKNHSYQSSFFIMAGELRSFRPLFPLSELDGKLGGTISLEGTVKDLSLKTTLLLKDVRYQNNLIHAAQIDATLTDVSSSPSGYLSCDLENIFFRDMLLSKAQFLSSPFSSGKQLFSTKIEGVWKEKISLEAEGFWQIKGPLWEIELGTCSGSFLNNLFSLEEPFLLGKKAELYFIDPCFWKIGAGDLSLQFQLGNESILLESKGNHIPLDILKILYPKTAFQGIASFQTSLSGKAKEIQGNLLVTLEEGGFLENKAKGSLQAHLNSLGAQIHSHLYATKNQFLDWTATFPLTYSYTPFSWHIDENRPLASELTMQGAVEEIFDFINVANHKASGWITAHLFLSKNKKEPSLQGSIQYSQGSYKNFASGTILTNIEGEIIAKNNVLEIVQLKASDEREGSYEGQGSLLLLPEKGYPFEIVSELQNMHLAHSDFIDSSVTGSLFIKGDKNKAEATGNLTVEEAHIQIFDDLPYEIPVLPITYINKPITLKTSSLEKQTYYPIEMDVELTADQAVFVKGKGLDSEWHGTVHLTGTATNLSAKGSLALTRGEFLFSGKTFALTQGEISFSDKPSPSAYLKIHGELQLPSATILAQMQGPLTSPTLTFQSIPALPTSSILSLILFNKDISEISALQALQLAQVFVSLSGNGGPDVLEAIRKSIGIDRLNIVGKDGTDEISVQIGWYLNHGITLSLSQSATSSDVTVEVDLKNGFIFQAETQNQEEGKFSLKWNKNY